jgi:hypothetical protein
MASSDDDVGMTEALVGRARSRRGSDTASFELASSTTDKGTGWSVRPNTSLKLVDSSRLIEAEVDSDAGSGSGTGVSMSDMDIASLGILMLYGSGPTETSTLSRIGSSSSGARNHP